ncbi:hypothetical protein LCGC14_2932400 [marine sediment metagenome]|uniref:Uncharacterized protein n=1 Tax=marine sediment metagenome TaxID=412755 RepID=A0A0F9ABJ1_9ZZZZ
MALENYRKVLELNPRHEYAKREINSLKILSSAGHEGTMRSTHYARDYRLRCGRKNYTNSSVCQHCGTAMHSENIDELLKQSIELENAGHFDRALMHFVRINEKDPARAEAYFYRGKAHCAIAEFTNALLCFAKAQELGFKAIQLTMYGLMARSNIDKFTPPNLSPGHLFKVETKHVGVFSDEKSWTANEAALQMLGQYEEAYKCYEKALEIKAKYEPA